MKKFLTVFLILTMLLTSIAATAAPFADVSGKNCETAVMVLKAFGIVEGKGEGAYAPEATLTRAEMATIILRSMQMEPVSGTDVFEDVPKEHWAYANVATAHQMGIIKGTSDTTFSPDSPVTFEQAVKMTVAALGYTVKAEAQGGYPSGYLAVASGLDLLKGVKAEGEMSRGDMAVLLYNALDAELFLQASYGEDAYEFEATEDKTLLSEYLKAEKITGAVTATQVAEVEAPARKLKPEEVAVGEEIMYVGDTDAQNMLGMRADIYFRRDAETESAKMLAIIPRTGVTVCALNANDFLYRDGQIQFETEDSREKKLSVQNAKLIYNGKQIDDKSVLEKMQCGKLRLIINDGSNIEYIIAEEYKNYIVDRVLLEEDKIYFKNEGVAPMVIDLDEGGTVLTNTIGVPLTLAELIEWDVLSIAESADKKTRRIYSSFLTVNGKVEEVSDDGVVIGGKEYVVTKPLVLGTIKVGMTATYSLDYTGAIAAVDTSNSDSMKYAWLVSASDAKGLGGVPKIKLFTENGEMLVVDAAERITVNNAAVTRDTLLTASEVTGTARFTADEKTPLIDKNGAVIPQLVKYELSGEGKLITIETATNKSNPLTENKELFYGDADFSMDWYLKSPANGQVNSTEFNGEPDGTANRLNGRVECINGVYFGNVRTDGNTKFFIIPFDTTKDKDYQIRSMSGYDLEDARKDTNVSFYDIDEKFHCGAMVMHSYLGAGTGEGYPDQDKPVAVVLGTAKTLSEDGEALNTLRLYTEKGEEIHATIDEELVVLYANTCSDIVKDTAWYATNGRDDTPLENIDRAKYKKRYKASLGDSDFTMEPIGALPMYLKVEDLTPGDVIQYELDPAGKMKKAAVQFRAQYPEMMELYQTIDCDIYGGTTKVLTYVSGGKVRINGTVKKTVGGAIMVETYSANNDGSLKEKPFIRALPNQGEYVMWDFNRNEIQKIQLHDIAENDEIFTYWANTDQKITVVYRNRK